MTEVAVLAAVMPAMGNPLDLPIHIFNALLRRAAYAAKFASCTMTEKDVVEAQGIGFDA